MTASQRKPCILIVIPIVTYLIDNIANIAYYLKTKAGIAKAG